MTVKELLEKTPASVYIVDNNEQHAVNPWNMTYKMFADCVIDTIEPACDGCALLVTLKYELVRKWD